MEELFVNMNNKLDAMQSQLAKLSKLDTLEMSVNQLLSENNALKQEVAAISAELKKKDDTIQHLTDQLNKCDQDARSKSLRIVGLPVNTSSAPDVVVDAVYQQILQPVLQAAIGKGEIKENAIPDKPFLIDNAFVIPTKKGSSPPVIVKLASQFVRNLVFRYKNEALPKALNPETHKERCKFAIFEDLSPGNHALLRSFIEDKRVKSAWSYNGQIKFKLLNSDVIYRAKSLGDTVDSVVKPGAAAAAFEAAMSP
jgi:outer membrane murein-binding lipoprotein Lpp